MMKSLKKSKLCVGQFCIYTDFCASQHSFFSITIFSPYFLQVGLLLQYVVVLQSWNQLSFRAIVNLCRDAVSNDKST